VCVQLRDLNSNEPNVCSNCSIMSLWWERRLSLRAFSNCGILERSRRLAN
jgi:hypothetical protein